MIQKDMLVLLCQASIYGEIFVRESGYLETKKYLLTAETITLSILIQMISSREL